MASEPLIGRDVAVLEDDGAPAGLGFGCAGLMRLASRRQRQRLLGEVLLHGVDHFDVARMYGLGVAESELGRFARGRRDQITIATKFGIEPGVSPRLARLQAPARVALARLPALRGAVKRRGAAARREPRRYDAELARRSLETSLRELGTDYVDFLFVHDPGPADPVDLDGIGALCEELEAKGLVRAWGISGEPDPCAELVRRRPGAVLQVRDEIFAPATSTLHSDPPRLTFGVLAGALGRIEAHLCEDAARRERWSVAVGRDCGRPAVLASLLLEDALDRNRGGRVLFSTTRPERVPGAVAAARAVARDPESPALRAFRELVFHELRPGGSEDG